MCKPGLYNYFGGLYSYFGGLYCYLGGLYCCIVQRFVPWVVGHCFDFDTGNAICMLYENIFKVTNKNGHNRPRSNK